MNIYLILALIGQLIASFSQILLKKSSAKKYDSIIKEYLNVLVIAGYLMLGISMVVAVVCYSGLDYMQVVVIEPIGYVIVMLLSRLFFDEKITLRKIIGIAVLLAGIFVFYSA